MRGEGGRWTADRVRRLVLRVHGSFLLVLTSTLVVVSTLGRRSGWGPFGFLSEEGWAYVGLYQAYLLMFLIGVVLWIGSTEPRPWRYDLVGVLAHVVPLSINVVAADVFVATGTVATSIMSMALHGALIALETFALLAPRILPGARRGRPAGAQPGVGRETRRRTVNP